MPIHGGFVSLVVQGQYLLLADSGKLILYSCFSFRNHPVGMFEINFYFCFIYEFHSSERMGKTIISNNCHIVLLYFRPAVRATIDNFLFWKKLVTIYSGRSHHFRIIVKFNIRIVGSVECFSKASDIQQEESTKWHFNTHYIFRKKTNCKTKKLCNSLFCSLPESRRNS